ncbi:MAG: FAD binding domain-containing protein, partial [Desulfotomaculales bacterium]
RTNWRNQNWFKENLTALAEAAASSAAPQVRNLGTIGGNLGTASPAGDLVTALVALGAAVKLASRRGEAEVPVEEFLVGPKKNILARDQLITEIKECVTPETGAGPGACTRRLLFCRGSPAGCKGILKKFLREKGFFRGRKNY